MLYLSPPLSYGRQLVALFGCTFVSEETDNINRFTELNMTSKFRKPKNSNPMSYIAIFRKEGGPY